MMIVFRLKWHLQVYLNNQSYGANVYINTNYKKNQCNLILHIWKLGESTYYNLRSLIINLLLINHFFLFI